MWLLLFLTSYLGASALDLHRAAQRKIVDGEFGKAVRLYQDALLLEPQNQEWEFALAKVYWWSGDVKKSLEVLGFCEDSKWHVDPWLSTCATLLFLDEKEEKAKILLERNKNSALRLYGIYAPVRAKRSFLQWNGAVLREIERGEIVDRDEVKTEQIYTSLKYLQRWDYGLEWGMLLFWAKGEETYLPQNRLIRSSVPFVFETDFSYTWQRFYWSLAMGWSMPKEGRVGTLEFEKRESWYGSGRMAYKLMNWEFGASYSMPERIFKDYALLTFYAERDRTLSFFVKQKIDFWNWLVAYDHSWIEGGNEHSQILAQPYVKLPMGGLDFWLSLPMQWRGYTEEREEYFSYPHEYSVQLQMELKFEWQDWALDPIVNLGGERRKSYQAQNGGLGTEVYHWESGFLASGSGEIRYSPSYAWEMSLNAQYYWHQLYYRNWQVGVRFEHWF